MRLLKRKTRKVEGFGKLELERVIGLTTASQSGLSCNATTGELAYLAGAVVVIYNVKANSQTQFLVAPKTAKAFSCVAYSGQGGRFLAAGESGHQPGIIIWEVAVGARVAELRAHKQGVCCVQFSPNGKHLVSVGVPSDGQVCLWDWRSGTLLAKSRASTTSQPACALQFASDGSFFVTGGVKHLKHWVIGLPKARSVGGNGTTGMEGKTVNLGTQKDSSFVAILSAPPSKDASTVTPDFQPLYALTAGGILCLLHCGLAIEKWVDLKVRHGYALAISGAHVGCACSDGIVRVFMHGSLTYAVTLPRPPPYGHHGLVDASVGATIAVGNRTQPGIRFPDAVACSFLQEGQTLAVIYGDHSLLVWDVQSFSKIGRYRTLLSHNACIWDVSLLPSPHQAPTLQPMNEKDCSPRGTFATCSADGSIRLWCLDSGQEKSTANLNAGAPPTAGPVNIYNKEILGVLYIDKRDDQKDKVVIGASDEEPFSSLQGFRTICASPDGQHLAAGDRNGNLRVYDLNTLQLIIFKEAHDGEVLSLSFTSNTKDTLVEEPTSIPLLASGGRDRLINIYDVNSRYDIVETLADHTALITSVKFACCGSKLLSCSADKSVIFRNVLASGGRCKFIRYHQELSPRGSFYDIDTDPFSKHAVAVGQDKKLSVLNLISGKTVRHLKLEGDVGEPFKVRLDPSGTYVVCSHSDRIMRIYDFHNGELLTQASGHAEIITGMVFLPDSRRLVSVSGDSCIFIWRLPLNMSRCMRKRCIIYSESRPPPRCLKSAPVHSSRYLDTTNSTPGGADQTILFDPLAVKSKEICTNGRKENFGEIKHIEATILSVGQDSIQEAAERPHTEAGENKKCYGCDGYSALSEIRKEVEHPLTSSNVNSNYTEQLDTNIPDNTRERRSLQHEESHLLTAQVNPRKEIQWKTVHTVFFSDNDYGHDELPSKAGHLDFRTCADDLKNRAGNVSAYSNTLSISSITVDEKVSEKSSVGREIRSLQTMRNSEDEDGVLTHPLDNHKGLETHKSTVVLVKAKASDELGERNERPRTCDGIKSGLERLEVSSTGEQSFGILDGFHQETLNHSAQSKHVDRTLKQDLKKDDQCYRISTVEWPKVHIDSELVKANTDDDFLIRRDLFSEYFPNLVSKIKVDDSDESSFSARFVARSTSSNPQSSWFDTLSSPKADRKFSGTETQALLQDDELEYNPGRLLADERERLKLRERQDKMAIEVQRMRERLVNLGIAVAEIAHDGETTDNKWDSDEKYPECCHYSMPSESPNKRSELAAHTAVEHEDSCRPNSSELPGSGQCAKRALSCSLQDRIANGTENLCTGGVSKTNCNGLSTGGLYSLDASAPGNLGTPRTPKIGRTIDLWQIKARKEPEDGKVESVGEVEIYLATNPASVKQAESSVDEGSGFEHAPSICRPIKIPSKAEVGRILANRGDKNVVERVVKSQGRSPTSRTSDAFAKPLKTELAEKKDHNLVIPEHTIPSRVAVTSTLERELSTDITSQNLEEGNCIEPQELNGRQSTNSETKINNHPLTPPSNSTFPSFKDALSSARYCEASFLVKKGSTNQLQETEMPGDKDALRKPKLFPKYNGADMNTFHGELTGMEDYDQFPFSSSGPLSEDHYLSTLPLPRPLEDYQKSLCDLMEAANKAFLLFGEVQSICRRTTTIPSGTTCTLTNASTDIFSVRRTYQRLLPGTLQTVQRLADEAAACGLSCHMVAKSAEDNTLHNGSPNRIVDHDECSCSTRKFQSRPVTGVSTSSFASVDVEGFISRYSETLASQVLALVHNALPDKQT